jgi:hypothetical protein
MTDREISEVWRENEYLKLRNAQLQRDIVEISADSQRLRQELERRGGLNRAIKAADPTAGPAADQA